MYDSIPFGKHCGEPLAEVPAGYLLWMIRTIEDLELRYPGLTQTIALELERRQDQQTQMQFAELLEREKLSEDVDESDYIPAKTCSWVRGLRWDAERQRLYVLVYRFSSLYHIWLSAEELQRAGLEPLG